MTPLTNVLNCPHEKGTLVTDTVETTDAGAASAPAESPTDAPSQSSGRRGRPRPAATIERDQVVLTMVDPTSGTTREALAAALGVSPGQAYLSLHRLRAAGLVRRERQGPSHSWFLTDAGVAAVGSAPVASATETSESPVPDAPAE